MTGRGLNTSALEAGGLNLLVAPQLETHVSLNHREAASEKIRQGPVTVLANAWLDKQLQGP